MDHGYGWLTIMLLLFWECEYEDDGTASHVEKKNSDLFDKFWEDLGFG